MGDNIWEIINRRQVMRGNKWETIYKRQYTADNTWETNVKALAMKALNLKKIEKNPSVNHIHRWASLF